MIQQNAVIRVTNAYSRHLYLQVAKIETLEIAPAHSAGETIVHMTSGTQHAVKESVETLLRAMGWASNLVILSAEAAAPPAAPPPPAEPPVRRI